MKSNKGRAYIIILVILGVIFGALWAQGRYHQRYENLQNPTEFLFHASQAQILAILQNEKAPLAPPPEPLRGAFMPEGTYMFSVYDHYTRRYWSGRQEERGEVDPPEAGRNGTVMANFEVHLAKHGDSLTMVSVKVRNFRQQIGRRYHFFPHLHKGPVIVPVSSDTYFEYAFLRRLGDLLGEKEMPSLKGHE